MILPKSYPFADGLLPESTSPAQAGKQEIYILGRSPGAAD